MKNYQKYFIIGGLIVIITLTLVSYLFFDFEEKIYSAKETEVTKVILTEFFVDVKGAVKNPGVYKFTSEERVFNAIEKAGGLTKNASTSNINLSQKLVGEMVVYIYTTTEIKNGTKNINCATKCNCQTIEVNNCYPEENLGEEKININLANLEDLLKLMGIGESKAKAIIVYREENGFFNQIEDLMKVSGIGQTIFESIKEKITV